MSDWPSQITGNSRNSLSASGCLIIQKVQVMSMDAPHFRTFKCNTLYLLETWRIPWSTPDYMMIVRVLTELRSEWR